MFHFIVGVTFVLVGFASVLYGLVLVIKTYSSKQVDRGRIGQALMISGAIGIISFRLSDFFLK